VGRERLSSAGRWLPELGHQVGGHLAAVSYLDAACPGPLADLGGVQADRRSAPASTGRLAGTAADSAGSTHIPRQRIPEFLGVPGVQVDLILGAVQSESDGILSGAAVEVIDEQDLYLLSYGRRVLTGL